MGAQTDGALPVQTDTGSIKTGSVLLNDDCDYSLMMTHRYDLLSAVMALKKRGDKD
jgi:hypothetical protein